MPRHLVNRARAFHIFHPGDYLDKANRHVHLSWEWLAAYLYVAGGVFLIIGSIFFLPQYSAYMADGSYMFVIASILYLWVSIHDLIEIFKATTFLKSTQTTTAHLMEVVAGFSYALGAALFIVGSILFLPTIAIEEPAALCFITGSCLFVVGACVNVVQTYDSPDRISLQYANLEAMTFVAGSCIYVCASIPYLFDFDTDGDAEEIYRFLAILYIWGSVMFLIGGIINIFRLLRVHDLYLSSSDEQVQLVSSNTGTLEDVEEEESEEVEEKKDIIPATPPRQMIQPPSTPPSSTLGESLLKGKIMRVASAEELVFGPGSSVDGSNDYGSQDFSIVEENHA